MPVDTHQPVRGKSWIKSLVFGIKLEIMLDQVGNQVFRRA
jgi:hypothetical protein